MEMELNNTFRVYLGECIDRFTDQLGEQGKEKENTISGFLLEQLTTWMKMPITKMGRL